MAKFKIYGNVKQKQNNIFLYLYHKLFLIGFDFWEWKKKHEPLIKTFDG